MKNGSATPRSTKNTSRTSGKWRARARSEIASSRATSSPPGADTSTSSPRRWTGSSATTRNSTTKDRARGRAGAATPTTTPNGSRPAAKSKWSRRASPTRKATAPTGKRRSQYVPTVGDRIEEAGLTWGIYAAQPGEQEGSKEERENAGPYKWAICPTFAECLDGPQKNDMHEAKQLFVDAEAGNLPNFADPDPDHRHGRDQPAQRHLDGARRRIHRERGEGDPAGPGRCLDDDLHLLRRLRLLLRPRETAGGGPRHQAPARDREPLREARLRRPSRRDQQLDPRLHGERAARRARG